MLNKHSYYKSWLMQVVKNHLLLVSYIYIYMCVLCNTYFKILYLKLTVCKYNYKTHAFWPGIKHL